ncbi:putative baseplate assembly protein [Nocardioides sp.]|uniref:putative baseplate assembly protein n=1 Tax=Nocardioides sp. TaxID=35761 RepID=UPI002B51B100|nr:putative baseplate assembly protein [Nocardioides sp.]HXH78128.1 putative baseplate assembly protein [Nocardioides sp.]
MTIPIPALDDRSYAQLVREVRARVPVHTPEWTNLNESDPGVTILELFSFLTENLLYRGNRIPEANRLKFLNMLGIGLQPASPGVGLVTISNDKAPLPMLPVPVGSEVRAGQVPFLTANPVAVLPVTAAAYYKQPQQLDAATLAHYQLLYQTFLESDADVLTFYRSVSLDPPATGKPDPVVDLGDQLNGTIDRSLWVALLGQAGRESADVRRAIAGQTLSIGVYPEVALPGKVLPPLHTDVGSLDPGLVVEIAAPEPDPTDPLDVAGQGLGVGGPRYTRLPVTYAEPVLESPGLIHVTLPAYEQLLLWEFDPEEDGTGDFPPRIDDAAVARRVVTWVRLRYPPLAEEVATAVTAAPVPAVAAGHHAVGSGSSGCGCGAGQGAGSAPSAAAGAVAEVVVAESAPAMPDLSMAGCCCDGDGSPFPSAPTSATATATGRITWVGVNATRVVQAVAVRQESLGLAPGTPFHVVRLANTPVIGAPLPAVPHVTGVSVEVQEIDGTWVSWHQIDDIFAAGREERAYTVDAATGTITFGSGLSGLRPTRGARIRASYWYGGGPQGQVAIGGIKKSVALPGGFAVANPVPTWGASAGESVADGEAAITRWLRHRDRLVTMDDFTDLTRRTPGVDLGRVETLPLFNPTVSGPPQDWPGMVTVMVIPRSDPVRPKSPLPDRLFLDAVCTWLAPRRLVTTELHVRGPVYMPVWASIGVVPLPGQVPSIVEQAVTRAVEEFLSPLTGGLPEETVDDGLIRTTRPSSGTGWPLGVSLRAQDIEAVATRVLGVRYVDKVLLATIGPDGSVLSPVDTIAMSGLELPAATVFCGPPPAVDPATLIAGSQAISTHIVPVPVVPDTC